jgi:hypothetical protein
MMLTDLRGRVARMTAARRRIGAGGAAVDVDLRHPADTVILIVGRRRFARGTPRGDDGRRVP